MTERREPFERIMSRVTKSGECWLWGAHKDRHGRISVNGEYVGVHVLSYRIHHGEVPAGMFVCHSCDTPSCVQPNHLFLGTPLDNVRDMLSKGRASHGSASVMEPDEFATIRRRLKLTQSQLADELGYKRYETIGLKERGIQPITKTRRDRDTGVEVQTVNKLQKHMSKTIRALRRDFKCACGKPACQMRRGLSQAILAKAVGVPTNTVSRWETGVYWPAPYDLFNLAEYLEVPVSVFFLPQSDAVSTHTHVAIRALKGAK